MKQNNNMQSTPASVPTAHDLLADLFYLATPTLEEEKLCQIHKHEIPAILNSLKHQAQIGKYIIKKEEQEMSETQTITKICTKCGKEKTLEEFNNDKQGKYGCKSICRECEKVQKSEYRASVKTCTPEPLKSSFDTDNFKRYLMSQIEFSKNVIQKMQGRIEAYQELISEL